MSEKTEFASLPGDENEQASSEGDSFLSNSNNFQVILSRQECQDIFVAVYPNIEVTLDLE